MLQSLVFHTKNMQNSSLFTGKKGEITVDTDSGLIYLHDGVTVGGMPINAGLKCAQIIAALDYVPLNSSMLGMANGIATLDANAQLVASQQIDYQSAEINTAQNGTNIVSDEPNILDGGFF